MEDRMLSDEVLLALIKKNGGGGTSDYSRLTNKPQINGVTLSGDKSASDLSLASLDANGKVPAAQLPSYVDDVINGYLYEGHFYEDAEHQTEITGESGKIYIDLETNKTYRWSGLAFVEVSESLALGETASTAYAGDKGKANADAITAIKDSQTIDSFGDVESALANKVDKVNGKGLSENDYTDADKAIVGGVTAALAGKQDALTAGNNIKLDNNTISVNRWYVPAGKVVYTIITSDENYGQNVHVQRHTQGGAFIDDRTFTCVMYNTVTIDDLISIWNPYNSFKITLLEDSDEQQAGYNYTVSPISAATSNSFTFVMPQEENANDLIIRSELDAKADLTDLAPVFSTSTAYTVGQYVSYDGNIYKCTSAHSAGAWAAGDFALVAVASELESKQNTLTFDDTPTDGSNNPVKSNGIYDALTLKANNSIVADDFSTATTYAIGDYCIYDGGLYRFKAVHTGAWASGDVDAIKITGELATLKSGLMNVDVALSVPENAGKNVLPLSLATIKSLNTDGTWASNVYTLNSVNFTVNTDAIGNITSITANGTATGGNSRLKLVSGSYKVGGYVLNGCQTNTDLYRLRVLKQSYPYTSYADNTGGDTTISNDANGTNIEIHIQVNQDKTADNVAFYPMIRPSTITDSTFVTYVPSVNARLESKCTVATYNMAGGQTVNILHDDIVLILSDRGGLYSDGNANRGLNDLVASTQITVTHVDASHVTVANNSQYGTSIMVIGRGVVTITPVE